MPDQLRQQRPPRRSERQLGSYWCRSTEQRRTSGDVYPSRNRPGTSSGTSSATVPKDVLIVGDRASAMVGNFLRDVFESSRGACIAMTVCAGSGTSWLVEGAQARVRKRCRSMMGRSSISVHGEG